MTPPVLFLVFNRPDTTARVFAAIREARPARLYVAADGPRADREGEAARCAEVRRIATAVDWPCEVETLFRDANLGCRRAVSGAITWFFEHEPEGIILEDDCLPHPDFFRFCADMLEGWRDDPRVMCITGNNFQPPGRRYDADYYFSIYNHCWGWASWRGAWAKYDAELAGFDPAQARPWLTRMHHVRGFADFWTRGWTAVREGRLDSWAFIWTWSCWANGGLTVTPRVNLVSNIGFGDTATHTRSANDGKWNLPTWPLSFPLTHPAEIRAHHEFDAYVTRTHFCIPGPSAMQRAARRLKRKVRRWTAQRTLIARQSP